MNLGRVRELVRKEFIHVFRDKRSRFLLWVPPLVQMLVFGYAASLDIKHVRTAVLDRDNSSASRELISRVAASPYFDVRRLDDERQVREAVDAGQVTLVLRLDAGFARDLGGDRTAHLQAIFDATVSNTTLVALGYLDRVAERFAADWQRRRLRRTAPALAPLVPTVELVARPWFNEDLRSSWFLVPGVIGNLTLVMVVLLTAFAIVREREMGTLEQIMVTPIRRSEFILGKTIPFFVIGLFDAALIALVGTSWFGVPLRGSIPVFVAGTMLFLLCTLGIGLLISTVSSTQQQAMVTAFFFNMPASIFSGFGNPISSMPTALQYLTYLDPLRYFLVVLRSVYLKGVGFDVLWPQLAAMAALALVTLTISVLRFSKSLD